MKYTILDTFPGMVKVKFEDGSWAKVPIDQNYSLEDIDDAVSCYDPDFRVDSNSTTNPNVSVGMERTSKKKVVEEVSEAQDSAESNEEQVNSSQPEDVYGTIYLPTSNTYQFLTLYLLANYFKDKNSDDRLMVEIENKLGEFISTSNITVDGCIDILSLDGNDDAIMQLAEEELNNG